MSFTHTFVTLNPNARVSKAAVAADIAATFPSAPPVTVGQSEETGVVLFDFGEVSVTAGVMPAPIPAGDLEACYPTSWLWPTAREELAGHSSHLLMMAQGGETPLDRIIPLTMTMAPSSVRDRSSRTGAPSAGTTARRSRWCTPRRGSGRTGG